MEEKEFTEINIVEPSLNLEITLYCDLVKQLVYKWEVIPKDPLTLNSAINIPFLIRPMGTAQGSNVGRATAPAPCGGAAKT